MSIDDRPTQSAPDDDPYLWLEEIEGARALDFVARQNRVTLGKFGGMAFERDRDMLATIYDRPDNIPYVSRSDGLLYNLWKDASHPRGLWRRTPTRYLRSSKETRRDPRFPRVLSPPTLSRERRPTGTPFETTRAE